MSDREDDSRPRPEGSRPRSAWSGGIQPALAGSGHESEGPECEGLSSGDEGNSSAGSEDLGSTPEDQVPKSRGSEDQWQGLEGSGVMGSPLGRKQPEVRGYVGLQSSSGRSEESGGQWPEVEGSGGPNDLGPRQGGSGVLGYRLEGSRGQGPRSSGFGGSEGLGTGQGGSEGLGPCSRGPGGLGPWFDSPEHLGLDLGKSVPRSAGTIELGGSGSPKIRERGSGRSESPGARSGWSGYVAPGLGASEDVGSEPGGSDSPGSGLGVSGSRSGKPGELGGPESRLGETVDQISRQEEPDMFRSMSRGSEGVLPKMEGAGHPEPRSRVSGSPSLMLGGLGTRSRESGGHECPGFRRYEVQGHRLGGSEISECPGMKRSRGCIGQDGEIKWSESGPKGSEDLVCKLRQSGSLEAGLGGSGGIGPTFRGFEARQSILADSGIGSGGFKKPRSREDTGTGGQVLRSGGSETPGVLGRTEFGGMEPRSGGLAYRRGGPEGPGCESPRLGGTEPRSGVLETPALTLGQYTSMGPRSGRSGVPASKPGDPGSMLGGSEGSEDAVTKLGRSGHVGLKFGISGEPAAVLERSVAASNESGGSSAHGSTSGRRPEVVESRQKECQVLGTRSAVSAGPDLWPKMGSSAGPGPRSGGSRHLGSVLGGSAVGYGGQALSSGGLEISGSPRMRASDLEPSSEGLEYSSGGPNGQRPGLRGSEAIPAGSEDPVTRLKRSVGVGHGSEGSAGPAPVLQASRPGSKQSGASPDPGPVSRGSGGAGAKADGSGGPRPEPGDPGIREASSEGSEAARSKLAAALSGGSACPGPGPGDAGPPCGAAGGAGATCGRCGGALGPGERVHVTGTGAQFHPACFVCAQCFQKLPEGLFYEVDGRMFCERDFIVLYAPCCRLCGEFIIGRVIRAMNSAWHPACFRCDACGSQLLGSAFVRSADRHLCHACHASAVSRGGGPSCCRRCRLPIEGGALVVAGDVFHPEHFTCTSCGRELCEDAAQEEEGRGGRLLCRPCRDRAGPTCGACRRPLERRGVRAMGRDWHVEHFVCVKCEKPFLGHRHVERNGLAYCETHYNQLFGDICFHCNRVVEGDVLSALNKSWCVSCFCCSACHAKLSVKSRFVEVDQRPVCKRCFARLPQELRRRLAARGRESRAQHGARP